MVPFAGYGFNKSHAAAYSVVAYRTGYLKANFPAEFIAANLTNEITSTDKIPQYIAEGRKMGLSIDPPDVNRSAKVFDVVDGRIVYGLLGIKGLGEAASEEIIKQREKDGIFTSFINFLERVDLHTVNKKAVEVMIKTGCFDNLPEPQPRSVLFANFEKAMAYADNKKADLQYGQASLFGDTDEKVFVDFVYEQVPDWDSMYKLELEKELIGFYLSGHPLDDYKPIINKASTLDTSNLNRAQPKKKYTIVGMITDVRTIITKKNQPMAFAKLSDLNGEINLTFFPKTWEKLASKITPDTVWGITGEIDTTREDPSFNVDDAVRPEELAEHVTSQIHISLSPGFTEEQQLFELREFLFAASGNCFVYFHMAIGGKTYVVNASKQLTVPSSDDFIARISDFPYVESVWKE